MICVLEGQEVDPIKTGIRRENRWKNTILTNGERPLTSYVSQGGAINRVLRLNVVKRYQILQYTAELLKRTDLPGKRFVVQVIKKMGAEELRRYSKASKELFSVDKMQKQT